MKRPSLFRRPALGAGAFYLCTMIALAPLSSPAASWPHWPLQASPGPAGDPRQDPATFPRAQTPPEPPRSQARPALPILTATGEGAWRISGGWQLRAAGEVADTGAEISAPGYPAAGWIDATVPGTVLTSLVDQGIYPEPTYGLNNLVIPESLNRQDYWYRTEFTLPAAAAGDRAELIFHGINYCADVWINGRQLGSIRGAFRRGRFDLGNLVRPGDRVALAVRVSPVPHPGIPHEESLAAGAGPNGGAMCFDGPTFFCTEGWDWIPGIRDRCTGIWQPVELRVGGPVRVGDIQVSTRLPSGAEGPADLAFTIGVANRSGSTQTFTLTVAFEGAHFTRSATLGPGETRELPFDPTHTADLHLVHPRLWWPNGYGRPELYHLRVTASDAAGRVSDTRQLRFGIREVSYELTALDPDGELRRFDYLPAAARGEKLIDLRHEALCQSPVGWVPSLTAAASPSPAIRPVTGSTTAPFLVIKVNGVPIVAKGGNWGLDEALKRCGREKLEAFIRLERDAHLTMIRNWCGQSTEEDFFDLCDEYGLMVWSDFWISTQNWNLQPGDPALWLDNAADTIRRFRHHPSIVLWCGRNEGVPPPVLNAGLDDLIRSLDGTRYYQPGSIQINLLNSGPWVQRDPVKYFSEYGHGFTTEIGLPCVPTADAIRAMMPAADRWPISDTWAYHDWHQADHGEVQAFMADLEEQFGAATDLDDFCRKAQMLNYVGHRAIFEGLNARLWSPASGRLLWMSHPAWPSTEWQLYSSDGDPNGAYFGAQAACEPLHVQLNLDDRRIVVVNTTRRAKTGLTVRAELLDLAGNRFAVQETPLDAAANAPTAAFLLDEAPVAARPLYFVHLTLSDHAGVTRSENLYWQARQPRDLRLLNTLPAVQLAGAVTASRRTDSGLRLEVTLRNPTTTPALLIKPTLRRRSGERVLPAFPSAGGFSLLPGESRMLTIDTPESVDPADLVVTCEGWNVTASLAVAADTASADAQPAAR